MLSVMESLMMEVMLLYLNNESSSPEFILFFFPFLNKGGMGWVFDFLFFFFIKVCFRVLCHRKKHLWRKVSR